MATLDVARRDIDTIEYLFLCHSRILYQAPSTEFPEAFLGGFDIAHGVMGSVEVVAEEFDVEFL